MTVPKLSLLPAFMLAAVAACAPTTKLTATWKAPEAVKVSFKRPLVVFQAAEPTLRRSGEEAMVKRIEKGTASYRVMNETELKDVNIAKSKVVNGGFDGAIVSRLVSTDQQQTYVPGSVYWGPAPYGTMWGYWGYAAATPGYMTTDTIVTLETNVYSVAQDKLIWSSRSVTFNPSSVNALIDSVFYASVREMKKQSVL